MRRPVVLALTIGLSIAPCVARAQSSPIVDLLLRARVALNDLHYADADSLATAVLSSFGDRLTREQRVEALSVSAAALYPDPAGGGAQRPDSALVYLARIVRADPGSARLRSDLSWPGLDSLFGVARQRTFAGGARPQTENALVGPTGDATIEVFTTRGARFRLSLTPTSGGAAFVSDSSGPSDRTTLRLRGFRGDRRALTNGEYVLQVTATDTATGDTVVLRYPATVTASPLDFVPVPLALDSMRLRPEMAPPARMRGVASGLLLGGAAAAAATYKGPSPLSSGSADSRGYAIGAAMLAGAILGGIIDKGHPLPENAAANLRLRAAFNESVAQAQAENRRRLDASRITVTVHGETR